MTSYNYWADGALESLTHDLGGAASTSDDVTYSFVYNGANQITSRQISNDQYYYTPNAHEGVSTEYQVNGLNQ